jgi:hypothetical protein
MWLAMTFQWGVFSVVFKIVTLRWNGLGTVLEECLYHLQAASIIFGIPCNWTTIPLTNWDLACYFKICQPKLEISNIGALVGAWDLPHTNVPCACWTNVDWLMALSHWCCWEVAIETIWPFRSFDMHTPHLQSTSQQFDSVLLLVD